MVKIATPAAVLYALLITGLSFHLHRAPGADPGLDGLRLVLVSLPGSLLVLMCPLPENRDLFIAAMTSMGLLQAALIWLTGRIFDSPLLQKPGPVIMPPSTRISLPEQ